MVLPSVQRHSLPSPWSELCCPDLILRLHPYPRKQQGYWVGNSKEIWWLKYVFFKLMLGCISFEFCTKRSDFLDILVLHLQLCHLTFICSCQQEGLSLWRGCTASWKCSLMEQKWLEKLFDWWTLRWMRMKSLGPFCLSWMPSIRGDP